MASTPPPPGSLPQGIGEHDFEDIEAAVTETVRGRWFLGEFARRNRTVEMRQLLDAIARLESVVAQPALPSADPSVRLMIQRIKEVAGTLEVIAGQLRVAGVDERHAEAVEEQARAVSGMLRGPASAAPRQASIPHASPLQASPLQASPTQASQQLPRVPAVPARLPRTDVPTRPAVAPSAGSLTETRGTAAAQEDPRLAILSGLDSLPLAEKLALFT